MTDSPRIETAGGFSLVQVTVVLTLVAIALAAALPGGRAISRYHQETETADRMVKIEEAIRGFRAAKRRLPCPADGTLAFNHASFGAEAGTLGVCAGANFSSGDIVGGMVPVAALHLPHDYARDGWGRRFTYVVDKRATEGMGALIIIEDAETTSTGSSIVEIGQTSVAGLITPGQGVYLADTVTYNGITSALMNGRQTVTALTANGFTFLTGATATGTGTLTGLSIEVYEYASGCFNLTITGAPYALSIGGDNPTTAMMALISHGRNGHGAWPARGGASRVDAQSTDASEQDNASVDGSFATNFDNSYVSKTHTATFDDIVHYSQTCE